LTLPHTELLVAEVLVGVLMGLELLTLGFGCLLQTAYSQVCVWVCVCVCESARVSVCVACEVFVCMYMCVWACNVCIRVFTRVWQMLCSQAWSSKLWVLSPCYRLHSPVCVFVCVYVCVCVCLHVCLCVWCLNCVCKCIHIFPICSHAQHDTKSGLQYKHHNRQIPSKDVEHNHISCYFGLCF